MFLDCAALDLIVHAAGQRPATRRCGDAACRARSAAACADKHANTPREARLVGFDPIQNPSEGTVHCGYREGIASACQRPPSATCGSDRTSCVRMASPVVLHLQPPGASTLVVPSTWRATGMHQPAIQACSGATLHEACRTLASFARDVWSSFSHLAHGDAGCTDWPTRGMLCRAPGTKRALDPNSMAPVCSRA